MFQVKILNELYTSGKRELAICERLLGPEFFPDSLFVMSLRACVLYILHGQSFAAHHLIDRLIRFPDFEYAEAQYDYMLQRDPRRIDDLDVISNVLYVTENKEKLAQLAHQFLALDPDRPEVCCLVGLFLPPCKTLAPQADLTLPEGNHYSLRQDHEKAVKYFRRAALLDRTYLPAWTLMGHEYVEMSNHHAAVEAYRRAVGRLLPFLLPYKPDRVLWHCCSLS